MRTLRASCILLIGVSLLPLLSGCNGKQDSSTTGANNAKTPDQSLQSRLDDPNVPQQQKDEIRKHMQPNGAASGGTAGSSGNATPPGGQ